VPVKEDFKILETMWSDISGFANSAIRIR